MSTEEREEFIKRWKERHGGDVKIMENYEQSAEESADNEKKNE